MGDRLAPDWGPNFCGRLGASALEKKNAERLLETKRRLADDNFVDEEREQNQSKGGIFLCFEL